MAHIAIFVHGTFDQHVQDVKEQFDRKSADNYVRGLNPYTIENLEEIALSREAIAHKKMFKENDSIEHRLDAIGKLTGVTEPENVFVFGWSGECRTYARELGGYELGGCLKLLKRKGDTVSVITHSHGGNVLGHALKYFRPEDKIIYDAYIFACPYFTSKSYKQDDFDEDMLANSSKAPSDALSKTAGFTNENLWMDRFTGVGKVKNWVYSFYSPYDLIQVRGAGLMNGMITADTRFQLEEQLDQTNRFTNYEIIPNGDEGMSLFDPQRKLLGIGGNIGKSHTDLNHAAAYIDAKIAIDADQLKTGRQIL